jgi:hypothetical protein
VGVEQLDQFGEVGERPGQAINLVDHDHVDSFRLDVGQQLPQRRVARASPGRVAVRI